MASIALQMYTMRNFMGSKEQVKDTLEKVAKIGYTKVQMSVPAFMTVEEVKEMLDACGLQADSALAHSMKIDEEFDQITRRIADAVLKTTEENMGVQTTEPDRPPLYQVQTGAFRIRQFADQMMAELQSEGFPAWIEADNGFFRVKVGAFEKLDNAVRMEKRLRQMGYNTFITVG